MQSEKISTMGAPLETSVLPSLSRFYVPAALAAVALFACAAAGVSKTGDEGQVLLRPSRPRDFFVAARARP